MLSMYAVHCLAINVTHSTTIPFGFHLDTQNYGRHLTLKDIRSLVAASPEHVEIARQWVHANLPGAQQQVGPTGDYLFVSTTADAVKMAFQVPLFQFVRPQAMRRSHSSKQRMDSGKLTTLVRSTTVVDVPSALVDAVEAIHGLDDFPPPFEVTGLGSRSQAHNSSATDATSINVTPDVIYSQYNLKFTDPRLHAASATQSVAEFEQAYFYTKGVWGGGGAVACILHPADQRVSSSCRPCQVPDHLQAPVAAH